MGQFALDIAAFVAKTKENADEVCRAIGLSLLTKIVLRSPVGNPELWASNQHAKYARETHNLFVAAINASTTRENYRLAEDASNYTAGGRLKGGGKMLKPAGQSRLKKLYPFKAGKGYTGGRFRGNWQVSFNAPSTAQLNRIDPGGNAAIGAATAALANYTAGPAIFISNNLPYGPRLEYEGWSQQSPAGFVRITVAEFHTIVAEAVQSTT